MPFKELALITVLIILAHIVKWIINYLFNWNLPDSSALAIIALVVAVHAYLR